MDVVSGVALCGYEKSWTTQYLPGFEVFGMSDRGGGLERANIAFQLATGERADVAAHHKFVVHNGAIYIEKRAN